MSGCGRVSAMTIQRPVNGHMGDMTLPPTAWPEADEDAHARRSEDLKQIQRQLGEKIASWHQIDTAIFDGSTWLGGASVTAKITVERNINQMESLDDALRRAIEFHGRAFTSILNAKKGITNISEDAQSNIDDLMESESKDENARQNIIQTIVRGAFNRNSSVVRAASTAITAGQLYSSVEIHAPTSSAGGPQR